MPRHHPPTDVVAIPLDRAQQRAMLVGLAALVRRTQRDFRRALAASDVDGQARARETLRAVLGADGYVGILSMLAPQREIFHRDAAALAESGTVIDDALQITLDEMISIEAGAVRVEGSHTDHYRLVLTTAVTAPEFVDHLATSSADVLEAALSAIKGLPHQRTRRRAIAEHLALHSRESGDSQ